MRRYIYILESFNFQPIVSVFDDNSISADQDQSIFDVDRNWTTDVLFNNKRLYQLAPIGFLCRWGLNPKYLI